MNKVYQLAWLIFFTFVYYLLHLFNVVNPLLLPPLKEIVISLVKDFISGNLLIIIFNTLTMMFKGILLATLLALLLNYLYQFKVFKSLDELLLKLMHPLPSIALLPIVITFIGLNEIAIIVIIIHSVIWPLLLNLISARAEINPLHLKLAKNYEFNRIQTYFEIIIPASFSFLFAGIKIGFARAFRAVISAEMIFGAVSGEGGLGYYLFSKRIFMDSSGMFAGLVVIIILGMIIEFILEIIQRRYINVRD